MGEAAYYVSLYLGLNLKNAHKAGHSSASVYNLSIPLERWEVEIGEFPKVLPASLKSVSRVRLSAKIRWEVWTSMAHVVACKHTYDGGG